MEPVTQNALLEALRLYGRAQARKPKGDGWLTLEEMASTQGVTRAAIRYQLTMARKQGVEVETATGSVLDQDGNARRATYYRRRNGGKP